MNLSDFQSSLMDIRTVFNEKEIKPGDLIKVFKVNSPDYEGSDSTFQHMGIVERVDFSLIKYHYYSVGKQEVIHHFLYPSDIYNGNNDGRFLFEVV